MKFSLFQSHRDINVSGLFLQIYVCLKTNMNQIMFVLFISGDFHASKLCLSLSVSHLVHLHKVIFPHNISQNPPFIAHWRITEGFDNTTPRACSPCSTRLPLWGGRTRRCGCSTAIVGGGPRKSRRERSAPVWNCARALYKMKGAISEWRLYSSHVILRFIPFTMSHDKDNAQRIRFHAAVYFNIVFIDTFV